MIGTLRRHQQWLWGIIIAATIVTFVYSLSPSTRYNAGMGSSSAAPDLGSINGEPITPAQFQSAKGEAAVFYYFHTGVWPNSEEQRKQLDPLAQQSLVLQALMKEYKINATTEAAARFVKQIFRIPPDQSLPTDKFNEWEKKELVAKGGLSEDDFDRFARHQAGQECLVSLFGMSGQLITSKEAEFFYRRENQPMVTEIVAFPATNFYAAATAPRPQILVADNGDWTKTTMTVEGPAIEHIYQLLQAPEKLRYVLFEAGHNYNQTSRQAVYQWFDRWLLSQPDQPVAELAFQKEPGPDLTVFADGKPPADAVSQNELIKYLIEMHRDQLERISPANGPALANYKRVLEPAWMRTLQLPWPAEPARASGPGLIRKAGYAAEELAVACPGENKSIPLLHFAPLRSRRARNPTVIVLAHPDGKTHFLDNAGDPAGLARQFLARGFDVAVVAEAAAAANSNQTSVLFTAYNRTRLQQQVRDLVAICQGIRTLNAFRGRVVLCGCGHAGFWSLLAAPAADTVIADCGPLDISDDQNLLDPDLFCPGIRNIDTFAGAAILAAPHPLVLYSVAAGFPTASLRASYRALQAEKSLRVESRLLTETEIALSLPDVVEPKSY